MSVRERQSGCEYTAYCISLLEACWICLPLRQISVFSIAVKAAVCVPQTDFPQPDKTWEN